MKLKLTMKIAFLLLCGMSFGQDYENDLSSLRTIDDQIQEEQYSTEKIAMTDRLIVQTPVLKKDKSFYSKKEWKKIKKQLKKNKRRYSNAKNEFRTHKTLDTIYLNTSSSLSNEKSRLSGW
ncbi:hypothetical protein [Aquimarina sediminis]|uniref:hypothetical protein n=1 Tax=Aquimarina sediminis TaxID=2070536 RepID=UPI000FFEF0CE|nr:hypothetical protein [Aquimarina sediminis]